MAQHINDPSWFANRAILTPKNADVDTLNDDIIERINCDMQNLYSTDTVSAEDNSAIYPPEFLNSLNISGLPPHKLRLKVGCTVMLLRNLDPSNHHCNGSRYIISEISTRVLKVGLQRKLKTKSWLPKTSPFFSLKKNYLYTGRMGDELLLENCPIFWCTTAVVSR